MECPFVEVGCSATNISTASGYQKHLSENIELHLEMIANLHQRNLGCDYFSATALDKLNAVNREIEYVDGVLQQYEIPSLKCIKTVLASPDIWLRNLGDTCSFRMSDYSLKRSRKSMWFSPPFFVQGGYKMKVCVYANGINSGASSHISVSLLVLFDDQLEWPISLPPNIGIRVELLCDDPDFEANEKEIEADLTWTPMGGSTMKPRAPPTISSERSPKRAGGLPPWCSPPPNNGNDAATASPSCSKSEEKAETTLLMTEKFAPLFVTELYAQTYNSLVFQVMFCLV